MSRDWKWPKSNNNCILVKPIHLHLLKTTHRVSWSTRSKCRSPIRSRIWWPNFFSVTVNNYCSPPAPVTHYHSDIYFGIGSFQFTAELRAYHCDSHMHARVPMTYCMSTDELYNDCPILITLQWGSRSTA